MQPIIILTNDGFAPGDDLPVDVTLEGASDIHIYSDPPGAVTYNGYVPGTTATVTASTSPFVSGDVTLYLATDGERVVSTTSSMNSQLMPFP